MKLPSLFVLTVLNCAIGYAANVPNEVLNPGIVSVTKDFGRQQYDLQFASKEFEHLPEHDADNMATLSEPRLITDAIEQLLDEFRDIVINGNDDIPPLDPLVIPTLGPIEYRDIGVSAEAMINNLRMDGLRWFLADRITVNPLRLSFGMTLTVPWLTITGNYDARARVAILTHTAGGNFRIFAHRIDIGFDMRMGVNVFGGGHLVLRELDVHIDIHDTQISITGMTGSSLINSFISSTIQNLTQDIIQSELENVSRLISEELFDTVNDVLKDYTVSDIFG